MLDDPTSEPAVLPVFPLPSAVLFPQTVLPLHIFEPRYRAMVREASAGDGRIAVALLRPGYEDEYAGSPAFFAIGTVGRISDLQPLEDGRFNLNLVGLQRVQLSEVPTHTAYRMVRCTPYPEPAVDEGTPELIDAKLELLSSHGYLLRELSGDPASSIVMNDRLPFVPALNGSCANLPTNPEVRQQLLEMDDLLARHRSTLRVVNEILERILRLKAQGSSDQIQLN